MKQFSGGFLKNSRKLWSWIVLVVLAILLKISSFYPAFIERYYSTGVYPVIGKTQRFLFGWIPFSLGDLLYAFIAIVILIKTWKFFRTLFKRKFTRQYFFNSLRQTVFFILLVYVLFYLLWGLNYSRKGITAQLNLDLKEYTVNDLDTLLTTLQNRLNYYGDQIDTAKRDSSLRRSLLFKKVRQAYRSAEVDFPFLHYQFPSVKTSLYSPVGHLLGFSGYYNPFSGEAQVKADYPAFLQPFIIAHEVGHQLGYAKEDEASFAGFLACRSYDDIDFRYSMYFDLYISASYEMLYHDMRRFIQLRTSLHTRVRRDYGELMRYWRRKRNFIEPFASKFYDKYLRINNQPLGSRTYDLVSYWLIAYYKKYGTNAL